MSYFILILALETKSGKNNKYDLKKIIGKNNKYDLKKIKIHKSNFQNVFYEFWLDSIYNSFSKSQKRKEGVKN